MITTQSANSIITDTSRSSGQGPALDPCGTNRDCVRASVLEGQPNMSNTASAARTRPNPALHRASSSIPVGQLGGGVNGSDSARALSLQRTLSPTRTQDSSIGSGTIGTGTEHEHRSSSQWRWPTSTSTSSTSTRTQARPSIVTSTTTRTPTKRRRATSVSSDHPPCPLQAALRLFARRLFPLSSHHNHSSVGAC